MKTSYPEKKKHFESLSWTEGQRDPKLLKRSEIYQKQSDTAKQGRVLKTSLEDTSGLSKILSVGRRNFKSTVLIQNHLSEIDF